MSAALSEPAAPCAGAFVVRDLDHFTAVAGPTVDQFEANGSGLAIGDLDDDGDLDIVLGNDAGPNSILWNEGGLQFSVQRMPHGDTRAVNLVDVDGDGLLDIVFTRRLGGLAYWRNTGAAARAHRFVRETLPGVAHPAYALAWADLDGDGDLDLVTGSYDAGLLSDLGNSFLISGRGGIYVYENRGGRFSGAPLAGSAQAMAIQLFDANRDGRPDIVVGNDFNVPDYLWLATDDGWQPSRFDATSHSTMGLDAGDIDNDGVPELFSSDMMPYDDGPATVAAWEPMMASMVAPHEPDDPQVMSNVLQIYTGVTGYQNAARQRGDATGWTWSAKFGDLWTAAGLLDLYAVNGFIESTIFAALPNHELVEENQALRNLGGGRFRLAPVWRLNSTASGRERWHNGTWTATATWTSVVNNLRARRSFREPAVRRRQPAGGPALAGKRQHAGHRRRRGSTPTGARSTAMSAPAAATCRATRRLHFGVPAGATLQGPGNPWPDGAVAEIASPGKQARC
ncbi:MAG: VCBS repeat-containing protein [Caldilineales bacterium]